MRRRPKEDERLLAPLSAGDQLPWKLSSDGEPLWLTVTDVVGEGSYLVRYPDGRLETLTDLEEPSEVAREPAGKPRGSVSLAPYACQRAGTSDR